jgi:DNA gyrase subunit A
MEIVQLVKDNMLSYAGAVNQARAIPDSRTGLKPIHRKIIYEMYVDKIRSSGKYKKCAYMVGQIIARFSEHGDSATYDALVRLAQPWIQRYPLLDFHGNSGSQFGDPSAAMRYTEAKLSKMTEDGLLFGLDKKNVDWIPNFTNEEEEPATLPAIFPGLFCLPNQGIGYAVSCNFLTYNLKDVGSLIKTYIETDKIDTIYYDLASGGVFINPEVMDQIYRTGKGSVLIEPKYTINKNKISITELPFNVMFDDVMEEIIKLCEKEESLGVTAVKNNSGEGKIEMIIEVEGDVSPQAVMNYLLQKTKLRSSYGVNQIALVDNKPVLLSMKDMLDIYIKHNTECIYREHDYDFNKTLARIEILEGLARALEDIENIIALIKKSPSAARAKEKLISGYGFSDVQAKAILDMKLARLANLEKVAVNNELAEKQQFAKYCQLVMGSKDKRKEILIERLSALVEKYGDDRQTEVFKKDVVKVKANTTNVLAAATEPEDVVITFNEDYIQSIPLKAYKAKVYRNVFKTKTNNMLLLFSNKGLVYRISVDDIKQCSQKDKGTAIGSICKLDAGEKILNVSPMEPNNRYPYITWFTRSGLVKKSECAIYYGETRNLNGMKAAGLAEDDEFIYIAQSNGDYALIGTTSGMVIKFALDDVRPVGKTAKGVKAIALGDEVYVSDAIVLPKEAQTVQVNGNSKKVSDITTQKRAGKGNKLADSAVVFI